MKPIRTLEDMEVLVKAKETPTVVVAYAQEEDVLKAVDRAVRENIVKALLVGDEPVIRDMCKNLGIDADSFDIVHEADERKSGLVSVQLILDGKADFLMKGLISTPYFLKAILNKDFNLVKKGTVLSHSTVLEMPAYDKLLIVSDVAMIPDPDLNQKVAMINYNVKVIAARLGIENPRVAIVTANEKVSEKMPATIDAALLAKMNDRGQIKGCRIDGPLAMDVAISPRACKVKKLESKVDGQADILIFPNIETGNVFYKTCAYFADAKLAAVVTGAPFPAVLVSRADDDDSKYYSIVLAAALI